MQAREKASTLNWKPVIRPWKSGRKPKKKPIDAVQKSRKKKTACSAAGTNSISRTERWNGASKSLNKRQSSIDRRANEIEKLYAEGVAELQRISQLTPEEAKKLLLAEVEKEIRDDMARIIRQIEAEAQEEGERKARKIMADAIQRVASEHVSEVTSSSVPLPSDEMKGRIIGRNGRNINAFEQAAGVDVIVDDTPEAVTISCFDPVRREVARRALEKLVLDGRIHPAHIEKVVRKEARKSTKSLPKQVKKPLMKPGVPGLHREITKVLGRLKFRTSYGQNQLSHAVETSKLASVIAAELGADVEVAKAGALLHDLGKAMDHNVEGTHAQIGAEFAKRYGVNTKVVNAIASPPSRSGTGKRRSGDRRSRGCDFRSPPRCP